MPLHVTKFLHSCLLVERDSTGILFDPGKFSFAERLVDPAGFCDLTAIVLTHYHPDHVDEVALTTIMRRNPSAPLFCNAETQAKLADRGIRSEVFETGTRQIGEIKVVAEDARHAPIANGERPQNTAYLLDDTILNPGDSYAFTLDKYARVPVLALPVMAPWATEIETLSFAARLAPKVVIPVHDGYAKPFFLSQRYDNFEEHFSTRGVHFERLEKPGSQVTVNARQPVAAVLQAS